MCLVMCSIRSKLIWITSFMNGTKTISVVVFFPAGEHSDAVPHSAVRV